MMINIKQLIRRYFMTELPLILKVSQNKFMKFKIQLNLIKNIPCFNNLLFLSFYQIIQFNNYQKFYIYRLFMQLIKKIKK